MGQAREVKMNKANSGDSWRRTVIALAFVALILIALAVIADSGQDGATPAPLPTGGTELADLLAQQATRAATPTAEATTSPLAAAVVAGPTSQPAATLQPTPTLSAPAAPTGGPEGFRARPLTPAINVRRGPGVSFEAIGVLRRGETAAVLARNQAGDWYLIRTDGGLPGWVAARVVELVGGDPLASLAIGVAATIPAPPTATSLPAAAAPATIAPTPDEEEPPPPDEPSPPAFPSPEPSNTPFPSPTETPNPYP
jgi:hypothetical protein